MKKKFTIIGPRVHDVEYKHFLANRAFESGMKGFMIVNRSDDPEIMIVLLEGNSFSFAAFDELMRKEGPLVTEISSEEFDEDVPWIALYFMGRCMAHWSDQYPWGSWNRKLDSQ